MEKEDIAHENYTEEFKVRNNMSEKEVDIWFKKLITNVMFEMDERE